VSFKYNIYIAGEGTPLVFQHGLTANVNQIGGLLGGLENVELALMDCPGHGLSSLEDFVPSFDNYADQVVSLMDYLGLESAIVGGLSMGSGIALNICLRFPERVKALILHRPAWLDRVDPQNLMILKEASPYLGAVDGASKFKLTGSYLNIETELPSAAKSVMGIFSDTQQPGLPTVIDNMVGDRPFDDVERLKEIKVPCLILGNDDDPLHPYDMAEVIHRNIEASVLKKITSRYIDADLHKNQVRDNILNFIKQLLISQL